MGFTGMKQNKKYIVLLGDGMADYPVESLGNRTPLEAARTPYMDSLAEKGIMGMVKTVPDGMAPGSDTANLAVFGYDPRKSYSGRAPLEAISMDIKLGDKDTAFRCNMVDTSNGVMNSFTAGHIDSAFSKIIIDELNRNIQREGIEFHAGVSYRNIMVWRNFPYAHVTDSTPPHDIQDKQISAYLPKGDGHDTLVELMDQARGIIAGSHAVNSARNTYQGNPEGIWLWGGGRRPAMDTLQDRYGLKGYTISAVDLIHGIGKAAGLTPCPVKGATGYIDTNYSGKAEALLRCLETGDFVYLHVEAPDESGHEGNLEHKMKAIEDFDEKIVGPVLKGMEKYDDYAVLVMPDHPTPLELRTHTPDPVPFCMFRTGEWEEKSFKNYHGHGYNEKNARSTGLFIENGYTIMDLLIHGRL